MRYLSRNLSRPTILFGMLLLLVLVVSGCAADSSDADSSDTTTSTVVETTSTTTAPTTAAPTTAPPTTAAHDEEGHDHDDEGHDHEGEASAEPVEVDEPRRLLVVASAGEDDPTIDLIDLADGSTESVEFEAPVQAHGSTVTESGRFLLLGHPGEEGGVTVMDTGVWSQPHGDHFHHYTSAPAVLGRVDGPKPSHLVSHDGLNTLWFDGAGEFVVVTEESLIDGEVSVEATVATGQPHHGFAVPTHGDFFVTVPTEDMEGLPNVVGIIDLEGVVQAETACPATHGEAASSSGVAAACSDGVALMAEDAGTWTGSTLPYPEVDDEDPWGYGDARAWGLLPNPGRSLLAAMLGTTHVLFVDPEEGTTWAVDLEQPVSPVALRWVDNGHLVAVTQDGFIHLIHAEDGSIEASLEILAPFEEGGEYWGATVTGDYVYITNPVENQVIEIEVDHDLVVERIFDLDFTPSSFIGVANG